MQFIGLLLLIAVLVGVTCSQEVTTDGSSQQGPTATNEIPAVREESDDEVILLESNTTETVVQKKRNPLGKLLTAINDDTTREEILNVLRLLDSTSSSDNASGVIDPDHVIRHYVVDPFPLPALNLTDMQPGFGAQLSGTFQNMTLQGLSGLQLLNASFSASEVRTHVAAAVSHLNVTGEYDLDGRWTWFKVGGAGHWFMNITGIKVDAWCTLNKTLINVVTDPETNATETKEAIQVASIEIVVARPEALKAQFDNLSRWSRTANRLINFLALTVFDAISDLISEEIGREVQTFMNAELAKLPGGLFIDGSADNGNLFDSLLERVKAEIVHQNLDPLLLKPMRKRIGAGDGTSWLRSKLPALAEAKVTNSKLYGLATLQRTGDVVVAYANDAITLEANMGFRNLTGSFDWSAKILMAGPAGSSRLFLSGVDAFLKLRLPLIRGAKPLLDDFAIKKIGRIWLESHGLGNMDLIIQVVTNLVTNAFKSAIATAVSGPVKTIVSKELDKLDYDLLADL